MPPASHTHEQVRCGVSLVGGASKPATVARVYDLCGPTYPGQLDADGQHYLVQYPGAMFLFAAFSAAPGQPPDQEMPAALPGGALPVAERLCIFAGSAGERPQHMIWPWINQAIQLARIPSCEQRSWAFAPPSRPPSSFSEASMAT